MIESRQSYSKESRVQFFWPTLYYGGLTVSFFGDTVYVYITTYKCRHTVYVSFMLHTMETGELSLASSSKKISC